MQLQPSAWNAWVCGDLRLIQESMLLKSHKRFVKFRCSVLSLNRSPPLMAQLKFSLITQSTSDFSKEYTEQSWDKVSRDSLWRRLKIVRQIKNDCQMNTLFPPLPRKQLWCLSGYSFVCLYIMWLSYKKVGIFFVGSSFVHIFWWLEHTWGLIV